MRTLLLPALLLACAAARAEISPISIRVEQVAGHSAGKVEHEQKRSLKVHLTNGSAADLAGLKVKYFYFGKDVKTGDVSIVDKGERGADVKAHRTELVETPTFTAKFTDDHSEKSGKSTYKKIEGEGTKLVGHAVQVFSGDKLLAEFFSEASLKAKLTH